MRGRKTRIIPVLVLLLLAGIVPILIGVVIPRQKYQKAMGLLSEGEYDAAYAMLSELGKDEFIAGSINERADALLEAGDADAAYALLAGLTDEKRQIALAQLTMKPAGLSAWKSSGSRSGIRRRVSISPWAAMSRTIKRKTGRSRFNG